MSRPSDAAAAAHRDVSRLHEAVTAGLAASAGALAALAEAAGRRRRAALARGAAVVAAGPLPAYAAWGDGAWETWQPSLGPAPELRIGTVTLGGGTLPATVPVGEAPVILVTESRGASQRAAVALRNLAVRAAAVEGSGVVLHLLDPRAEGFGFPERTRLANVARRTSDVAQDLKAAVAACHAEGAGRRAAQHHLVVALDFPHGYGHGSVEQLNRVARLAPAGATLILHHDASAPLVGNADALDLVDPVIVTVAGDGTAIGPWGDLRGSLDDLPPESVLDRIATWVSETAGGDRSTELSWSELNPADPGAWWQGDARAEVRAPFGLDMAGEVLELALGKDADGSSRAHAVIGGMNGSGKSVLMHTLITSLASRYAPDEVSFYLLDGKQGAEFQAYRDLPHADVVTLRSMPDLLRGMLVDLNSELDRRLEALVLAGVSDVADLPPERRLPRLIVAIDEYQDLLRTDAGGEAIAILQRLAAQGRAVGIHLLPASQRFHATGLINQDALFANIGTRIALAVAVDSLDGIDEFDSAGRALIREHCDAPGKVVINDAGGRGVSRAGRVALLQPGERDAIVAQLARRSVRRPVVMDGDAPPAVADSRTLARLAKTGGDSELLAAWAAASTRDGGLGRATWHAYDRPFVFLAGRTFTVFGSAAAVVNRGDAANIMVVTDDAEVATGVLATGLVSAGLSVPRGTMSVSVLGELPGAGGSSWKGVLSHKMVGRLAGCGHRCEVAEGVADAERLLRETVAELERRQGLNADDLFALAPRLVVGVGLERLDPFRMVEERYGPEPSELGRLLLHAAKEGPRIGVHVLLGATSRAAWAQVLPDRAARQFRHRFFGQMSETDAHALFDSGVAARLQAPGVHGGPRRAGYEDRTIRSCVRFLPYVAGSALDEGLTALTGARR